MRFKIDPKNRKKQFDVLISRAEERLEEAKILFRKEHCNGAISRAYYSFFETAHAVLITKGISAKTHAGLITLFSLHFIKTKQIPVKFIRFFKQAKEAREEADYEIYKDFSKEAVETGIKAAKEFIRRVEEIINI